MAKTWFSSTIPIVIPENFPYEKDILSQLERKIVGQDHAANTLVRRMLGRLSNPVLRNGPLATLFFMGPTGVGKTEMAHALGEVLFRNRDGVTVIPCERYQEHHTAMNLFGAPKSYIGHGEGTPLTDTNLFSSYKNAESQWYLHEVLRERMNPTTPVSILIFDEIEKIHPSIGQSLLWMISSWKIEFASSKEDTSMYVQAKHSRITDLSNTIIIFTSNIGEREIKKPNIGFTEVSSSDNNATRKEWIAKLFPPEFIGRIDDWVTFNPLGAKEAAEIVRRKVEQSSQEFQQLGYYNGKLAGLRVDENVVQSVVQSGYSKESGARDLLRKFDEIVFNEVSKMFAGKVFDALKLSDSPHPYLLHAHQKSWDEPITFNLIKQTGGGKKQSLASSSVSRSPSKNTQEKLHDVILSDVKLILRLHLLYEKREECGTLFKEIIQETTNQLRKRGYTEAEFRQIRAAFHIEYLQELARLFTHYEGNAHPEDIFYPVPQRAIEKYIRHMLCEKVGKISRSRLQSLQSWDLVDIEDRIALFLRVEILSGIQRNTILEIFHRILVEAS